MMTDEAVLNWCIELITLRSPESDTLDYKREVGDLTKKPVKLELAKDASSFANERGGVLVYGVPEETESGVPIPKPLAECGLDIEPGLLERMTSILTASIDPVLPEMHIRAVTLPGNDKHLIVVTHPSSWAAPHMVSAYNDVRYYRRNNFQAVPMPERTIEAAYGRRQSLRASAATFFEAADHGWAYSRALRVILYPHLGTAGITVAHDATFRQFLEASVDPQRRGSWLPFLEGWRFASYAEGNVNGRAFEMRVFRNGAFSYTYDLAKRPGLLEADRLNLRFVSHIVEAVVRMAGELFKGMRIGGSVLAHCELVHGKDLRHNDDSDAWLTSHGEALLPLSSQATSFVEETSVSELACDPAMVSTRIMDRLASAFGLERRPGGPLVRGPHL